MLNHDLIIYHENKCMEKINQSKILFKQKRNDQATFKALLINGVHRGESVKFCTVWGKTNILEI